jgi:hypothetical protein
MMEQVHDFMRATVPNVAYKNCFNPKGTKSNYDLTNAITVLGRLGKNSAYGEAYKVVTKDKYKHEAAIKVIPVGPNKNKVNPGFQIKHVNNEIKIMIEISRKYAVNRNYIPNLPMIYDVFFCNQCSYQNKNLLQKNAPKLCAIFMNELASGDLKTWDTKPHSAIEFASMICQNMAGLVALQQDFILVHDDLNTGNFLYTNVPKGGYWHYRFKLVTLSKEIEQYDFYIPNAGEMWKIWDFGFGKRYQKITPAVLKHMNKKDVAFSLDAMTYKVPKRIKEIRQVAMYAAAVANSRLKTTSCVPAFEAFTSLAFMFNFDKKPKTENQIINKIPFETKIFEYKMKP